MDQLRLHSRLLVAKTDVNHVRFLHKEIHWDWRLIGIKGARGVGKTTLLLQQLQLNVPENRGIYLSLDDLHFTTNTLRETVEHFRATGITHFFLDEVHKYRGWSREIKNLYDLYADIFLVFTGSSIIEINQQDVDLSRRAVLYELPGLSFREYLQLTGIAEIPPLTLHDVIERHEDIALQLTLQFRPLEHFVPFLKEGYYPYFLENRELYPIRVKQVVGLILETDLATAERGRVYQIRKIGQLLQLIADSVPFKPNIQQLAAKVQLDRVTLIRYLHHLENARLIALLYPHGANLSALQKPEKIFLDNSNLAVVLSSNTPDIGNLRETFFYNQTRYRHIVSYSPSGDFRIEDRWTIEVGGKNKGKSQITAIPEAFLALDDMEIGAGKKIPLWLFGLIY